LLVLLILCWAAANTRNNLPPEGAAVRDFDSWGFVSPSEANHVRLDFTAPDFVREVIGDLGRTEDVKFSPKNTRLAVSSFSKNQLAIFDVSITHTTYGPRIALTDVARIASCHLKGPHGVDFIDDERVVVANRDGDVTIFALPRELGGSCHLMHPTQVIRSGQLVKGPGAVSVTGREGNRYEILVCNNYADTVTKHWVSLSEESTKAELLLRKWINFPDALSASDNWIAVSNHRCRNVLLYNRTQSLNETSVPDGILRYIYRPHGVRFTSDGRFLLVADYETPYLHIYERDKLGWRGVRGPTLLLRVMSNEVFLRGPSHGPGVKGVDIDQSSKTLVTTGEIQPLAFFNFAAIVEEIGSSEKNEQRDWQIAYELYRAADEPNELEIVRAFLNSTSWRITAPLRWVGSFFSRNR
jgi:WD40 repeat protein